MKIAVVGSRNLNVEIGRYIPSEITLLISGGAKGIDTLAERWADENNVPKMIFKPDYQKYGKFAPLIRNEKIVNGADVIIAIWDGKSHGTKYTIDYSHEQKKKVKIFLI